MKKIMVLAAVAMMAMACCNGKCNKAEGECAEGENAVCCEAAEGEHKCCHAEGEACCKEAEGCCKDGEKKCCHAEGEACCEHAAEAAEEAPAEAAAE